TRRGLSALGGAGALAIALLAPVACGLWTLLQGTQRMAGFDAAQSLVYSVRPPALLDVLLPSFFGDPHTFSDLGYWGQPFFPDGYPYLLSLYLGCAALTLALHAGRSALRPGGLGAAGAGVAPGWSRGPAGGGGRGGGA